MPDRLYTDRAWTKARLSAILRHLRDALVSQHDIKEPLLSQLMLTTMQSASMLMLVLEEYDDACARVDYRDDQAFDETDEDEASEVEDALRSAVDGLLAPWDGDQAGEQTDEHADDHADEDPAPARELDPARALSAAGPPIPPLRHLTRREIEALLKVARAAAARSGLGERALAIFLAHVLPRFKGARGASEVGVPSAMWRTAAHLGGVRADDWRRLFDATELFELIRAGGHFDGQLYAAAYRIAPGVWEFDDEAPSKPLHVRSGGHAGASDRQWASLQAVARGDDGSPGAIPKSRK